MMARANHGSLRRFAAGILALGILFIWAVPGVAIEVVRDKAKTVENQPKPNPGTKKTGDTAAVSTSLLLHDVRSQKQRGSVTDSLDTWIDRNGDGVNDYLKKTTPPPKIKSRTLKSSSSRPAKKPTGPGKTVVKKRHTSDRNTKPKAVPRTKKLKSTTDNGAKKKDPR